MAKSIEDLYQQYAGRASDPEGLAYWTRDFGDTIDANEISIFQNAVAEARAQGTEPAAQPALTASQIANTPGMGVTGIGTSNFAVPAVSDQAVTSWLQSNPGVSDATIAAAMNQFGVTPDQMARVTGLDTGAVQARYDAALPAAATPTYFQQNPDVAAAYQANSYGMTPDQFAASHFQNYGVNEQRAAPTTGALAQATTAAPAPTPTPAAPDYEQMVRDAYGSIGRTGIGTAASNIDQAGFDNWVNALQSGSINPADLSNTFKSSVADYLIANPTDQYSTYVADYLQQKNAPEISGVQQLYQDVLGRDADASGLGTFYKQFGSEISPEERALFEQSARPELQSRVRGLYKDMLGRDAEQEGVDYWTKQFGSDITDAEREQFRQSAAAELTGAFGGETPDDAGLLAGFKRAKDLGISDDVLKRTLGEELFNKYDTGLTNFAVTNLTDIVADNQLTWDESQKIHNFGRDLGFTPDDLARMTGQDKSLFELADTTYKAGRDQIINGSLTAPTVTSDADRVLTGLALQNKYGFTDEELSAATGVDVNTIKSSLDPVRNFSTTFSSTVNSPDTTTAQLKTLIADSRGNAAINKMYGDSLNGIETKLNGLEQKWGSQQGVDPLQAENLFQQLEAQKNALGGQYYSGVFGDTMNMAAVLNRKGLETIDDLGQKDKFQTESSYKTLRGPNGEPVQEVDGRFVSYDYDGNPTILNPDQVTTSFNKVVYDDPEGGGRYVPLSAEELATLKDDGTFQNKIGTVVIDKDTGKELTTTDGVLAMQRSGGKLTSKKHYVNVGFTDDGRPILTASQEKTGLYGAVSELAPMVLTIASFIPGPHQPFARLANAALALEQDNYLGAVLSGLSAFGSFTGNELATLRAAEASGDIVNASQIIDLQNTLSNVKLATTFVQGAAALQAENLPALINAGLSAYTQMSDTPLPSGVTTAVQLGNLGIAIENKQYDQALNALGDLTGSQDVKIAGSAKTLIDEFSKAQDTGDFSGVINAGLGLVDAVNARPTAQVDQGGITNRITDDMTEAGAAAYADAKRAGASDADALAASNALTRIADANETFDGSALGSQNEAMNAAIADGKDRFTFGGKTFTIDNSAAMIADFENSVAADTAARAKTDPEFGDLAGAITDATARNTVAIGNTEADNVDEAAYLAKVRNPSATSFTFDGKTYTVSASQSQMAQATRNATLAEIRDLPNFNDAYARARATLGPNQTFEWNGKQYSTATAAERPDLSAPKVQAATDESAAETARLARQNTALITGNAPDQSAAETTRLANLNAGLKSMEKTGFLEQIYKDLNNQLNLNGIAANEYLKNSPNSPITQSVSTAFEAAGELQRRIGGGTALAFDNKPLADKLINSGNRLQEFGQSIGSGPEDTKNWKDTVDLVDKAKGPLEKAAVFAGRFLEGKSGLARQVEIEFRQELPALFMGAGLLRPTMIASGVIDAADTGGGAVIEAYDETIKNGGTHKEGLLAGRKAGAAAAATELVIQATLGKLGEVAAGKLDNIISKGATKIFGETAVEAGQEGGASLAVNAALGQALDVNKAWTEAIVGGAVGKGTATAASPVDAATASTAPVATAVDTAAATTVANNINTAITSGNVQNVGNVITENVTTSLATGAGPAVVIDSAITSAITGGADAASAINSTVTAAINSGANLNTVVNSTVSSAITAGANVNTAVGSAVTSAVAAGASIDTTLASAVSSAVKAGADVNVVIQAATAAAANTGNNVTISSDASVVTINNATANTNTTVNTTTGVTTTVDNANNVTTTVDGNTTTVVDANANITSQTKVDGNIQTTVVADANANTNTQTVVDSKTGTTTSTTVDNTTNSTTQTTITADTQTTVLTDPTTNTQTTVKINVNTGDVIEVKETEIPTDWKPPVIEAPKVPGAAVATETPAATPSVTTKPPEAPKLNAPEEQRRPSGGAGLPSGINVDPASLKSRVTGGAIDPLERVKQAQAELERDVMMNQMDPRFLAAIQQRTNPNQQAQQLDTDVGALAKLLRGDSDAPANEGKYYSYGSEDSIDDILGGRAANYAAGGYVEPLKASGGSMALPLLAKSGGALGKYKGREDFKEGKHVAGEGDGQSDDIPAWLADGEFVFPADVVSALGNGSTKAGTDKLYEMMHSIRDRARSKGPKDLPPPALKSPLDYLKSSKRSSK
jgi:hypothetical protein